MNRPSILTSEISVQQVKAVSRWLGPVITIGVGLALMLGFRFEKPGERVTAIEKRVTALEKGQTEMGSNIETLLRLQCLSMSRRDAQLAGECLDLPTSDESTRVRR